MNIPKNESREPNYPKVPLPEALKRIQDFAKTHRDTLTPASFIAPVIWPDRKFRTEQGAGAAASIILKKLGFQWKSIGRSWGWNIHHRT